MIKASTVLSTPGCIDVYNIFDDVDADTTKMIHELFSNSQIKLQKVQKQQGSDDCGLFTIAFAVSLARKTDPSKICFIQLLMRAHLINCFQEGQFISFHQQSAVNIDRKQWLTMIIIN